jgi:hypothetical protein
MVLLGWDSDRGVREMRRGAHGPVVIATACSRWLQRAEEGDEVGLLLARELDVEAGVVEVDGGVEVRGEAVVEVRKGRSKTQVLSTHCDTFKCFRAVEYR